MCKINHSTYCTTIMISYPLPVATAVNASVVSIRFRCCVTLIISMCKFPVTVKSDLLWFLRIFVFSAML